MGEGRILDELKHDAFGCVELLAWRAEDGAEVRLVRRVVSGRLGAGAIARRLARREERALRTLRAAGMAAIAESPELTAAELAELRRLPTLRGAAPRPGDVFLRPFAEGLPLHRATRLPLDFFDRLEDAVRELHAAGICHNDLHKEQNVVVTPEGGPVLIDFQLATRHPGCPTRGLRGRWFLARCQDDLRHVQKHRRRYTRDGRGPESLRVRDEDRMRRRGIALVWMKTGKPLYKFVTRRLLGTRDGEEHRPSSGPWPQWGPATAPERGTSGGSSPGASAPPGRR